MLEDYIWAHVSERIFITRAQFDEFIQQWALSGISGPDGGLRFIWMRRGPEVHIVRVEGGAISPRVWLKLAQCVMADHGRIITKIEKDDTVAMRFVERLGGQRTEVEKYDVCYTIERLTHAEHFRSS